MTDTKTKPKLYNLTLHRQNEIAETLKDEWVVEVIPRLRHINNPQNWSEMKKIVSDAVQTIPSGSSVLVGGMTQICILIAELKSYKLHYVKMVHDGTRPVPISVNAHESWSRKELYEVRVLPWVDKEDDISNEGNSKSKEVA